MKRHTEEFKRDAIVLVDSSGKTVTAVARELGISSESLRGRYRKAKADRDEGQSGEPTSAEREELRRLRRENREQQQTIEMGGVSVDREVDLAVEVPGELFEEAAHHLGCEALGEDREVHPALRADRRHRVHQESVAGPPHDRGFPFLSPRCGR